MDSFLKKSFNKNIINRYFSGLLLKYTYIIVNNKLFLATYNTFKNIKANVYVSINMQFANKVIKYLKLPTVTKFKKQKVLKYNKSKQ